MGGMSIRVHCLGFRGVGSQVDRIEEGFKELGCELTTPTKADFIYANDSGFYEQAGVTKAALFLETPIICNVLDLAPHLGAQFPLERVRAQLANADAVTCISTAVQQDIGTRLGRYARVIYNPIRPVTRARYKHHPYRAMFVGRVGDPAKRAMLGATALSILGFDYSDMVTVGREQPHYGGVYLGEVSDKVLGEVYNSVDFVMFPSGNNEGLGLPPVEAMACGAIPVICRDLSTREEFFPSQVFPEYLDVEPNAPSIARFVARFMQDNAVMDEFKARLWHHYKANWESKLNPRGVAEAILGVYQTL